MSTTSRPERPQGGTGEMFNQIAERYDMLNRIISMGMDRGWRRLLVDSLKCGAPGDRALDVATGTADVALSIVKAWPQVHVTGLDPSTGMLGVGEKKVAAANLSERIKLVEGDAQEMPFEDDYFAASCISFGIRNVPDRLKGLSEMTRVTRPGGKVSVLELAEPNTGVLAPFARFHVHHVVPRLGAWLSGAKEYRYLQESIAAFPSPEEFASLMEEAGLVKVEKHRMSFGAAFLYIGTVPS